MLRLPSSHSLHTALLAAFTRHIAPPRAPLHLAVIGLLRARGTPRQLQPRHHHQRRTYCSTTPPDTTSTMAAPTEKTEGKPAKAGPQPHKSQMISIEEHGVSREYTAITEGKATILFPGGGEVFYNPIQNFNRDLSVLAIKTFGEGYLREREEHRGRKRQGKKRGGKKEDVVVVGKGEGEARVENGQEGSTANHGEAGEKGDLMDVDVDLDHPPTTTADTTTPQDDRKPNFRILDALSATGLRALRYALELPFATALSANDLSASAVTSIRRNLAHNHPQSPTAISKITPTTGTAQAHMYNHPHTYHVIDLDPYGTASPFLDAALQAIVTKDSGPGNAGAGGGGGGLLCVTCTDAGVWASTGYSEKCFALYGGQPIKGDASHEAGLRLILYSIATTAARYGLAIEPLLSLSVDFYARVFVRVRRSPQEVKNLASRAVLVHNCDSGCGAWRVVPLGRARLEQGRKGEFWKYSLAAVPPGGSGAGCEHCGGTEHIGGPMWGGDIHDAEFCRRLLETAEGADPEVYTTLPRLRGLVGTALNEATFASLPIPIPIPTPPAPETPADGAEEVVAAAAAQPEEKTEEAPAELPPPRPPYPPTPHPIFFVLPTRLSKVVHSVSPTQAALRGALLRLGYPVGRSHCRPNSIKTTAPFVVIWEVMRQWVERFAPVKEEKLSERGPGRRVLKGLGLGLGLGLDGAREGGGWEEVRRRVGCVEFDEVLGRDEERVRGREVRYQMNPTANWGPMKAAKGAGPGAGDVAGVGGRAGKRKDGGVAAVDGVAIAEGGQDGGKGEGEGQGEGQGEAGEAAEGVKRVKLDPPAPSTSTPALISAVIP